jgi:hypothetical protein
MGVIAAQSNMPSAKFVNPANLDTIPPNKDFTIQMKISNVSESKSLYFYYHIAADSLPYFPRRSLSPETSSMLK